MISEIYIISGFLGAGKTTFIQKLLKEAFSGDNVVLIENDFGEISIDAALLKSGGVNVKELNSGCICCSLSGDFVKSLKEVAERFYPDKVIIEPSGVGKLSDIVRACEDKRLSGLFVIREKITVADAGRCRAYLDNFGEFFEDQIENADIVLLSRADVSPEKSEEARRLIEELNGKAFVFSAPWDLLNAKDIISSTAPSSHGGTDCRHHEGHADCCCDHEAVEVFDMATIRSAKSFTEARLRTLIDKAEHEFPGRILRAKGIVRGPKGFWNIQYVPGSLEIKECGAEGDMICFVGRNLDCRRLKQLFESRH